MGTGGDAGFAALQTPFLVTTLAAATAVTRAPVAKTLLTGLSSRHVVGLALSVQEPRQLLTTRPLFGSDLAGAHIRVANDHTATLIQALGGVPAKGLAARETTPLLRSGKIDGAETSPTPVLNNAYSQAAPYLSAYGLIPKINTMIASAPSWRQLTEAERDAVRAAATDTRDHAATAVPDRENTVLGNLCSEGLVVDESGISVVAASARRAAATAPAAASNVVTAIKHAAGDTGVQTAATVFPPQCQLAQNAAHAESVHRQHTSTIVHHGGTKIPVGTYVTKDTVADFRAGAVIGPDWRRTSCTRWSSTTMVGSSARSSPTIPIRAPCMRCRRYVGTRSHSPSTPRPTCSPRPSNGATTTARLPSRSSTSPTRRRGSSTSPTRGAR